MTGYFEKPEYSSNEARRWFFALLIATPNTEGISHPILMFHIAVHLCIFRQYLSRQSHPFRRITQFQGRETDEQNEVVLLY